MKTILNFKELARDRDLHWKTCAKCKEAAGKDFALACEEGRAMQEKVREMALEVIDAIVPPGGALA